MFTNVDKIVMIDDDPIHTTISEISLRKFYPNLRLEVVSFNDAKKGLEYLLALSPASTLKTLLFLDINMPIINGWHVLTVLDKLDPAIKEGLGIYILSSSLSASDIEKAHSFPMVKDYLKKPFFTHFPIIFKNEIAVPYNTDLYKTAPVEIVRS